MNEYHRIWLESHPARSQEWLEKQLEQGFEVHHIDCDHSNNHPDNLVLIEAQDHHFLHGRYISLALLSRRQIDLSMGETAYKLRVKHKIAWCHIAKMMHPTFSGARIEKAARHYATLNKMTWPIETEFYIKTLHKRPVYRGY